MLLRWRPIWLGIEKNKTQERIWHKNKDVHVYELCYEHLCNPIVELMPIHIKIDNTIYFVNYYSFDSMTSLAKRPISIYIDEISKDVPIDLNKMGYRSEEYYRCKVFGNSNIKKIVREHIMNLFADLGYRSIFGI